MRILIGYLIYRLVYALQELENRLHGFTPAGSDLIMSKFEYRCAMDDRRFIQGAFRRHDDGCWGDDVLVFDDSRR